MFRGSKDDVPQDLTASVWGDMLRQCEGDKEKAKDLARGMTEAAAREEQQGVKERVVEELEGTFKDLGKEAIVRVLQENNWDPDRAILPLFEMLEAQREQERARAREEAAKKREEERVRLKEEATKKAKVFLRQLFSNLPDEEIQKHLDANEGDVDATVEQLLAIVTENEEQEKKEQARQAEQEHIQRQLALERQIKTDALKDRFAEYVSEEEIAAALEEADLDVPAASIKLLQLTEERKLDQLSRFFTTVNKSEILDTLNEHNWDMKAAMEVLGRIQQQRKATLASPKPQQLLLDSSGSNNNKGKEKVDRDESFLLRSAILGKELNELIQVQKAEVEREADANIIFRRELEEKIRFGPEDVPGLPGMIPLTRKMIDKLRSPVDEEQEEEEDKAEDLGGGGSSSSSGTPVEEDPMKASVALGQATPGFTLRASPERLDVGGKITVSWEATDAAGGEAAVTSSDWIGMYVVTDLSPASPKRYYTWNWIGKAGKEGSVTFPAREFGVYVFRYFRNRSYALAATSNSVTVGPEFALEAVQRDDASKLTVDVRFQHVSGNMYNSAWVALYEGRGGDGREVPDSAYKTYQYLSAAVDRTLAFEVPKAGDWEFRLFPQRAYYCVARCPIRVRGEDRVELALDAAASVMRVSCKVASADPTVDYVWVGIYRTEERDNRMYRKYKYLSSPSEGVSFRTCTTPGTYEARLFSNKYYEGFCCKSNTVVVE